MWGPNQLTRILRFQVILMGLAIPIGFPVLLWFLLRANKEQVLSANLDIETCPLELRHIRTLVAPYAVTNGG